MIFSGSFFQVKRVLNPIQILTVFSFFLVVSTLGRASSEKNLDFNRYLQSSNSVTQLTANQIGGMDSAQIGRLFRHLNRQQREAIPANRIGAVLTAQGVTPEQIRELTIDQLRGLGPISSETMIGHAARLTHFRTTSRMDKRFDKR